MKQRLCDSCSYITPDSLITNHACSVVHLHTECVTKISQCFQNVSSFVNSTVIQYFEKSFKLDVYMSVI